MSRNFKKYTKDVIHGYVYVEKHHKTLNNLYHILLG